MAVPLTIFWSKFDIGPNFAVLWFKICSNNHNEISHTSRQCNCRDVCKILMWSVKHILNKSTRNFGRISNSIEISLVGQAPDQDLGEEIKHFHFSVLTHWGRDEMNNISQTTLSNAFSWMKILEFQIKFHWSLFLKALLTIFQHWFW